MLETEQSGRGGAEEQTKIGARMRARQKNRNTLQVQWISVVAVCARYTECLYSDKNSCGKMEWSNGRKKNQKHFFPFLVRCERSTLPTRGNALEAGSIRRSIQHAPLAKRQFKYAFIWYWILQSILSFDKCVVTDQMDAMCADHVRSSVSRPWQRLRLRRSRHCKTNVWAPDRRPTNMFSV